MEELRPLSCTLSLAADLVPSRAVVKTGFFGVAFGDGFKLNVALFGVRLVERSNVERLFS